MKGQGFQCILLNAFCQRAERLLFHHTNPWELDEAMVDWGYAIGPCEAQDLIGLEQVLAADPGRPVPILPRMVAEGRQGKGAGVGYYRYPGGGGAVIDPLIEDLILEEAWFAKVTRHDREDAALVEAMNGCIRDMVNLHAPSVSALGAALEALHFPLPRLGELVDQG